MRHRFQNLAILALTLSIGAGSMAVNPAGPDAPCYAGEPPSPTPSGSVASWKTASATGVFRFKPLGLSSLRPHATDAFRAGSPTSIDQLVWEHPLLSAIDGLPIKPNIKRHSIIADRRRRPGPDGGDGLVPYASANDPRATSELVVTAGHLCLDSLEVIGEVARSLKEHATDRDPPIRISRPDERSRGM